MRRIHVSMSLCCSILAVAMPTAVAAAGSIQIFARTLTGSVTLDVDATDSIENVQQKLQDKTGINAADVIFNFQGTWMDQARTLADYGVVDESVIHSSFVTEFVDLETGGMLPTGQVNLADAAGTAGNGWLHFRSSGGYDLSSMDPMFFDIALTSFHRGSSGFLSRGQMANFDSQRSYRWEILTAAAGITGFDASLFSIDASGIENALEHDFTVQLSDDGTTMYLAYNVPGPGALGAVAGVIVARRRRR